MTLDRLLNDRHIAEARLDALHAVAGHEHEWNVTRFEYIGDRIHEFAAEIDVDYARVDFFVHGGDHGLRQPAERPKHGKPEFGENVLHHHRDEDFVLDQQDAVAALKPQRQASFVVADGAMHATMARGRIDHLGVRQREREMQPLRTPVESDLAVELALDAGADHANAESRRLGRRHRRAAVLVPLQHQIAAL